ncbi:MAG: hypothetical protein ACPG06_03370 [Alphaproteobacteria bacterium]
MSLETIYYIGQTIAVVALVLSLGFVGVQIRQNTRATRASSHHAVTDALNQINFIFATNDDVTNRWLAGIDGRADMSPKDQWQFDAFLRAYFHACETMFVQAQLGVGDREIMIAEEGGLKFLMNTEGAQQFWDENLFGFGPNFRAYVERLRSGAG